MFGFLKKLFGTKPTVSPCPEAPYKIETPAPVKQAETPKVKSDQKKPAAPKQSGNKKPRKPKSKA